jgi:hypothetical protein
MLVTLTTKSGRREEHVLCGWCTRQFIKQYVPKGNRLDFAPLPGVHERISLRERWFGRKFGKRVFP